MKRLLCLLLALGCLAALPGCRSHEERQEMRRQLDYASGKAAYEPAGTALEDGTTLEEQVFYDGSGITCTILGIYEDEDSYYLPYSIRNDSKGEADVTLRSVTLNGWNMDLGDSWAEVISGGMEYGEYQLHKDSLPSLVELGAVSSIQLWGSVYCDTTAGASQYQDFNAALFTSNPPTAGEDALPGQSVYEDGNLSITYLGLTETSWNYQLCFVVENKSDETLYFNQYYDAEEDAPCPETVNGLPAEDFSYLYSLSLAPGTKGVLIQELECDVLEEELGIRRANELTSVSFPLSVEPEDRRSYDIALELALDRTE